MTDDDKSEILRAVYDVDKRVALVDLALTEHVKSQDSELRVHIATCLAPSQIDALAAMQRTDRLTLTKLDKWYEDVAKQDAVTEATDKLKLSPVKWVVTNVDRLMWIVIAAFLLYKFGL